MFAKTQDGWFTFDKAKGWIDGKGVPAKLRASPKHTKFYANAADAAAAGYKA